MIDNVEITTLANGLRVVSEDMPRLQTASLGVWVDVGTRYEPAEVNGVAHMLEHMAFKGTERRSARAIAEEIERVGGSLNAYTSREHTAYYARILAGDVDLAADILADILQHSAFDPDELEKERHVVLQEIGQVKDTPDDLVFDLLQEASYPDQPMGRAILGPEEIVAVMPREAMIDYMARHYGPSRLVFAGAGRVEHARLVDLAGRLFGSLPATVGAAAVPANYVGGTRIERRPDLEQVHLCLAMEAVPYHHPDHFVLQVLSTALGGGMSSRLFQEARENRGLCYSVFSFASAYADTGQLGVYAGTDPEDLGELMQVVAAETRQLIDDPSEDELARARAQLKASLLMGLESCSSVCEDLARQLLCFGRHIPTEEVVARIDAVDTAAVRRAGRQLLTGKGLTLAAVGPLDALPNVDLSALAA
ncbi:MAG: pitrilysin family protein [Geminicoccaceae bacterium]